MIYMMFHDMVYNDRLYAMINEDQMIYAIRFQCYVMYFQLKLCVI